MILREMKSGFTLIEYVLVILVILILGAVLVPRFQAVYGARVDAAAP